MARFATQFTRKLHVAFATMLLITLALAWYFSDSVRWYQYDVERIALANIVLHGYQEVSILTFQEFNDLEESVARGDISGLADWQTRATALREAISRVRQGIAAEVAFDQNASQGEELESLVEIERAVEEIIRSSALIDQALVDGKTGDAADELNKLRSTGVAGYFSSLVITAFDEQKREARNADRDAVALANYITNLLPIFMSVLVVITLFVIFLFSRSLTRSVNALHDGARAFTSGDLEHEIPQLREKEFSRLGEAFNTMAQELSDHRTRLHDTNVRLEATVDERTRALQASNKKLAEVDVNRRKLLADISHEFRTPLTVIRGESEIALRGANKTKVEYKETFQRIMDQADHTTRLVDDLLFMARADAGEPRLKLRSVGISSMVDSVCKDFAAKAEQRNISINQSREGPKAVVHGDAGRLRQIFTILMDNALRYSNPGGSIEIQISQIDSDVQISFRDHGIGLTEEDAELAFERFYRGHKAEEHARGTGLGLPVAKAIVEAHNGSIFLHGKLGDGATATVTLPAESRLRVVA
jgi:two-component system OmpR family sensor kinase